MIISIQNNSKMDSLINKWKQTVENHKRKLSQLREESLGRSFSKEKSNTTFQSLKETAALNHSQVLPTMTNQKNNVCEN